MGIQSPPPPIFCTSTTNIKTAILLQQFTGVWTHIPTPPTPGPTPFEEILNLEHNIPPLTHFTLNNKVQHTYNYYDRLLQQLKQHLRAEKLQILSADNGPGLILIPMKELTELYREHLQQNATTASIHQYNETLRRLKVILYLMKVNIPPQATTDDRPPTCYFKIKTHKPAFTNYTTAEPHIHIYTLGGKALSSLSRPIINHKNSITTHCSNILRKLITPIINNSPFLTKDIHHTISRLCTHGPPAQIYTGDIEKFSPNTPHSFIIEAMAYYRPRATGERHILRRLLEYNYTSDGNQFIPLQQEFRQPVLLHPQSASVFRATKISTDPADCLDFLLRKYLPSFVRNGHNAKETVTKITNNPYFPTRTLKQEWEFKPIIKFTWTETRPTKKQIQPLELQDYHLIPSLPLAPLKSLLCYQPPSQYIRHNWEKCSSPSCRSCNSYDIIIDSHLPVLIAPCNDYRCIYLLHHPKSNGKKHVFLASTLIPNTGTTGQTRHETTIAKHLSMGAIRWKILTLIPGTYSPPYRTTDPKIMEWRRKVTKQVEDVIIHEEPWSRNFYNKLDVEFH